MLFLEGRIYTGESISYEGDLLINMRFAHSNRNHVMFADLSCRSLTMLQIPMASSNAMAPWKTAQAWQSYFWLPFTGLGGASALVDLDRY